MIKFPIVEIFSSIQGEGCNLGKAANFIRFAGCNLKCPWCDTDWSKPKEGILSIEEILSRLNHDAHLVVLTGGEPMIQPELDKLIDALMDNGWRVAIETNGTRPTDWIKQRYAGVWITCSPKPEKNWQTHPSCFYDEIKYVVDGNLTIEKIEHTRQPMWLQPEGGEMQKRWQEALAMQRELLAEQPRDIRIGVQLHKLMEVR